MTYTTPAESNLQSAATKAGQCTKWTHLYVPFPHSRKNGVNI